MAWCTVADDNEIFINFFLFQLFLAFLKKVNVTKTALPFVLPVLKIAQIKQKKKTFEDNKREFHDPFVCSFVAVI